MEGGRSSAFHRIWPLAFLSERNQCSRCAEPGNRERPGHSLRSNVSSTRSVGTYGGLAAVLFLALAQLFFAAGYLWSCESRSNKAGACEPQWVAAQALLFGAGGTTAGLFTRNPLIREPRPRRRDDLGRFSPTES